MHISFLAEFRTASENLHSLFDLVCFVHDLVNRDMIILATVTDFHRKKAKGEAE